MKILCIAVLCAPLCFAPLLAQNAALPSGQTAAGQPAIQGATESDEATRIILDVTRVNILFTVTDKKGRFVTDLGKNDFDIVENKRSQTIQQFTAESDLPLRLAVLVDTSNSIRDQFRFEQQAAVRFMQSVLRPREDRIMLVSFRYNSRCESWREPRLRCTDRAYPRPQFACFRASRLVMVREGLILTKHWIQKLHTHRHQ